MPAQQLRNRLNTVFSDQPWRDLQAMNPPALAGNRIADLKALVVHETSGWPPRSNGVNMFNRAFRQPAPTVPPAPPPRPADRLTTQLYISGDGTVLQGMQLPNHTNHAGFVNDRALGCETGHGWGNYGGNDHLGPFSTSDSTTIVNPHPPPARINGPTYGRLIPVEALGGNAWMALTGDGTIDAVGDEDLPGLKFFVRHAAFNEVVVGIWTTERYDGPWRQPQRYPEMVFTEGHYRAWALLARWVAEEYLLPRNFSLLPGKVRAGGNGSDPANGHGTLRDAATFASIVLADEGLSRSPQTFGLPAAPVPPTRAALEAAYTAGVQVIQNKNNRPVDENRHWKAMFRVYRGFHGHGYSGDAFNGDHDCPGPMFDWHRFAREVWDWWWWPFDFDAATPDDAIAARDYSLATRDGGTRLKEHFWSTPAATIGGRSRDGIHGARSTPRTFELPQNSRVYAVANGQLVAARFPAETEQVSLAFILVQHEVFHRLDARPAAPAANPPVFANRIDYDLAPASFFTLYMHLGRPAGMSFANVADGNPDWLNRVIARKKEATAGAAFRTRARRRPDVPRRASGTTDRPARPGDRRCSRAGPPTTPRTPPSWTP